MGLCRRLLRGPTYASGHNLELMLMLRILLVKYTRGLKHGRQFDENSRRDRIQSKNPLS